ncbi:10045_t:CDS:2 [Funneliformis geosporum]|nr:10045_t:CDS:2 [Funneliformis geosporum]
MECFSQPEPQKHFLRLSQFQRYGYDEESVMEGLKAKNTTQWEIAYYKAEENLKNHIDDIHTLSGNIILEAFAQLCERFIEI